MIASAQVAVGATATKLLTADDGAASGSEDVIRVYLRNTRATDVFLGASTVTITTGYNLAAGASLSVIIRDDEELYGIAAVSGTVHVLASAV